MTTTNSMKRINIARMVNTKSARQEKRNGRDVIVVPAATMPDNIIMNRIQYPGEEIRKSFKTLERSPAPFNHPMVNGKFVSSKDPEGLNIGWIGAWNENVRYENNKLYLDKIIDVERANQSDEGKRVLEAINRGEPIHTSTGLLALIEPVTNNKDIDGIARNIVFDHDAILLDMSGAATPAQGVGMFVNSDGAQLDVINSIWEDADRDIDWAVVELARALEKRAKAPFLERIKAAVTGFFDEAGAETKTNVEEAEMSKELDELSAKVDALTESLKGIGDTIVNGIADAFATSLKPLVDAQEAALANEKAKEEAEKSTLIEKVVKANLLEEGIAKETPLHTLRALANNVRDNTAAPVRPGTFKGNSEGVVAQFKVPAADKAG
jgi:hypothetical protein